MSSVDKTWLFAGAGAIAATASLFFSVDIMNPFAPMPLYMVVMAWTLSYGFLAVMPAIYLLEFQFLSQRSYFGKVVLISASLFAALNAYYFSQAWSYGYKYQGEFHTKIVAAENLVGFAGLIILAYVGVSKKSKMLQYSANLFLFLLLSWCAFPYLGELP
jgi:hypothetical protein